MSIKLQFKKFITPVVVLLLALALVVVTASPAFANGDDPGKPIPGLGKVTNAELRTMLLRERAWYDSQYAIIRDAYELASLFQSLIDDQKARGKEVTDLETALSVFYGEIAAAEASRAETAKILGANAGFNGYFNVIDRNGAGQTVLDARDSLKGTHFQLTLAMKNLKQAYHSWRQWILRKQ